jgi:hypothetical protein
MFGNLCRGSKRNNFMEMAHYSSHLYGSLGLSLGFHHLSFVHMIQQVLTITTVGGAAFYLFKKYYDMWKENKTKCTGCAVHQLYLAKQKRA